VTAIEVLAAITELKTAVADLVRRVEALETGGLCTGASAGCARLAALEDR
jgi:hypothetical protein